MEVKFVRACAGERLVEVLNPFGIAVGIINCTSIGATVGDSVSEFDE